MNNNGDQSIFGIRRISPVLFGSGPVEANHRVFHSADGSVDADRNRIGVIKSVSAIHVERMNDGVCAVLAPQGFGFVWVIAHGGDAVAVHMVPLGVPDKLSA